MSAHIRSSAGIKPYLVCLCLLALCFHSCRSDKKAGYSQDVFTDTAIEKASFIYENGNIPGAIRYMDSLAATRTELSVKDKYTYYYFFHDMYVRAGNFVQDDLYIDSMINLLERTGNTQEMSAEYATAVFAKADRLLEKGKYDEAYKHYYKARRIAESSSDDCSMGYYTYKMGLVLFRAEQYQQAVFSFKEASRQLRTCHQSFPLFYRQQELWDNIGLCYAALKQYDSAIYSYKKALSLVDEGRKKFTSSHKKQFDIAAAVIFGNLGTVYKDRSQYSIAEELFKKSAAINALPGYDNVDAQYTRLKLAAIYFETGRDAAGNALTDTIKAIQDTMPVVRVQLRLDKLMWESLARQGREAEAYPHLLAYMLLNDSLQNLNKQSWQIDVDEKIEGIAKQDQINFLEQLNKNRGAYLAIAVLFCVALLFIIFFIINNWRTARKNVRLLTIMNERVKEQKKQIERALKGLEIAGKEKDRILKAVSHDMRSPINSAYAITDMLLADSGKLSAEHITYINLVRESCNNALILTKDLLEIATLNMEKLPKDWYDIKILLSNTVELLRFRAVEKKQRIELQVPDQPVRLYINNEKIARVINNLVTNAIKFSPSGRTIMVGIDKAEGGYNIYVKDSGIGIPDNMKEKVFDIFTEAKRFGTSGEQPFGLGLSISRQIIEAHQGRIWFEDAENGGTVFYIFLPKEY